MRGQKLFWRINENIRAESLRVIDDSGKQLGIITREEALDKAKEKSLTLVEIAPNANPPVAKIVEFGKFRYQEEKKQRQVNKSKGGDIKEIRFSPFIAEHDFEVRFERVKEFLEERNKVRLVCVFKGRQMGSKQFGYDVLGRVTQRLRETINIDMEPKFLGKHLIMVISPLAKGKKALVDNNTKDE